jgi:ribose 1,5-bisphosphokinase PhnN
MTPPNGAAVYRDASNVEPSALQAMPAILRRRIRHRGRGSAHQGVRRTGVTIAVVSMAPSREAETTPADSQSGSARTQ